MDVNFELKETLNDLFTATRILTGEGVIDGFGHVSARSPVKSEHYYMLPDNLAESFDEEIFVELDLESDPVLKSGPRPSIERFIHGEIYRARPDIKAVVHTHSPAFIPFGVSNIRLRPLYHMCGFLESGAPVFDIAEEHGITDLLVTSSEIGQSLARSLGQDALVLMRGHGAAVVGSSVKEAVFRAVYAAINAQLQPIAMQMGTPKYLSSGEAKAADKLHLNVLDRPWDYWVDKFNKAM